MKKVKIGKFDVPSPERAESWKGWEIVNEVGVGRWIGKVIERDPERRIMTMQPALQLSSPAITPVIRLNPQRQWEFGQTIGLFAMYVLNQPSDHPIRDMYYSSRQCLDDVSDDLRHYCYRMIAAAEEGNESAVDDPNEKYDS